MRIFNNIFLASFFLVFLFTGTSIAQQNTYSTILRNGTILDGTGHARNQADVGIRDGFIISIGDLSGAKADHDYDVSGLFVTPGFISVHSHARQNALSSAKNMLTQGVTTEIMNPDGGGATDIPQQLQNLENIHPAVNVGVWIGFNSAWAKVVGAKDRQATAKEMKQMHGIIKKSMVAGAWGVSSGLRYIPALYATTDEVINVVKAAAPYRSQYQSHIRSESLTLLKAVKEDITIGEKTGLVPEITHIKAVGKSKWGDSKQMLDMMRAARAKGTYAMADQYPYIASQSGLTLVLPRWATDGGLEAILDRLKKPKLRSKIRKYVAEQIPVLFGTASNVLIPNRETNLAKEAKKMQVEPAEAVLRLLEQEKKNVSYIGFYGAKKDLIRFVKSPMVAVSCDCGSTLSSHTHPRYYGSWPKVLGRYVRQEGLLTWEQAIRKMTGLPATMMGFTRRGFIAAGMVADITVFDPKTIIDHATYKDPKQYATGVKYVFQNGHPEILKGKTTGGQFGQVLRKGNHEPTRPMSVDRNIQIAGRDTLQNTLSKVTLSFNISQDTTGHTVGRFHLIDNTDGVDVEATLKNTGMLQATKLWSEPWASFTGMVESSSGKVEPLLLIIEGGSGNDKVMVRIGQTYKVSGYMDVNIDLKGFMPRENKQ